MVVMLIVIDIINNLEYDSINQPNLTKAVLGKETLRRCLGQA